MRVWCCVLSFHVRMMDFIEVLAVLYMRWQRLEHVGCLIDRLGKHFKVESALELTVNENSTFFKEYSKAKSTGRAESSTLPASAVVSPHSQLQGERSTTISAWRIRSYPLQRTQRSICCKL